jgi:hypothetical protein
VELEPFHVAAPAVDAGYQVLYRLRSADGSQFPSDGSLGAIYYAVAIQRSAADP